MASVTAYFAQSSRLCGNFRVALISNAYSNSLKLMSVLCRVQLESYLRFVKRFNMSKALNFNNDMQSKQKK